MNILVVPPKTISSQQKASFTKKGIIVIESDNPDKVRLLNPEVNIDTNDFFMAALKALEIDYLDTTAKTFVRELYKRLTNEQ